MTEKDAIYRISKEILVGKKIKFIDNLIFLLSNKNLSGWAVGNRLRNKFYGKRNHVSDEEILFIGGAPRSGTSLLQNLLRSFDGVEGPYSEICLFQDIKNEGTLKEFDLNKDEIDKMKKDSEGDVIKLSESVLKHYKKKRKLNFVILKAPKYTLFIDEIFRYFPNSKFINIIRDGRDVSLSMKKFFEGEFKEGYPFDYCVKNWVVSINSGKKFDKYKNYKELKYEDLVKDPVGEMAQVAKFLNVKQPSKESILNYFKTLETEKIGKLSASHKEQLSKPVYTTSTEKWKREMSEGEKTIFKKIAGEILIREGYAEDNEW